MSKKAIQKLIEVQYEVMNSRDNKDRIRHVVAGIKNGKFYTHAGVSFGTFDKNAPDTEFISESDLDLARITGSKLKKITENMTSFFNKYEEDDDEEYDEEYDDEEYDDEEEDEEEEDEDEDEDEDDDDEDDEDEEVVKYKKPIKKGKLKKPIKKGEPILEVNVEKVVAKCKKAIKKGKLKKAEELLKLLPESKEAKKLAKKIKKAL